MYRCGKTVGCSWTWSRELEKTWRREVFWRSRASRTPKLHIGCTFFANAIPHKGEKSLRWSRRVVHFRRYAPAAQQPPKRYIFNLFVSILVSTRAWHFKESGTDILIRAKAGFDSHTERCTGLLVLLFRERRRYAWRSLINSFSQDQDSLPIPSIVSRRGFPCLTLLCSCLRHQ